MRNRNWRGHGFHPSFRESNLGESNTRRSLLQKPAKNDQHENNGGGAKARECKGSDHTHAQSKPRAKVEK
jgi:hypothetical protein